MPKSFFSSDFFAANRRRLLEIVGMPIVLSANGLLQKNGDSNYLFRQDSNFWYLTGLDLPDAVLVIDTSGEYLIIPALSPTDEIFGAPHDLPAMRERSGIRTMLTAKKGWERLRAQLERSGKAGTLLPPPAYHPHYGFYTNPARKRLVTRLKRTQPGLELQDIRPVLNKLRVVKQAPELAAIQQAIDITVETLGNIKDKLGSYKAEYEIEADMTAGFRSRGAGDHAFAPIIAGGHHTTVLHYQANNALLKGASHLYVDVGAEVEHYAADITRTWFLKKPTARQKAVFEAVMTVSAFARDNLKPGVTVRENERAVEQFMGEQLKALGLIRSSQRAAIRRYYPHASSHYLGLDVHDVGDYDQPLAPGMVLTVEPGIYIEEEGFGVRLEDDVLVTKDGIRILSDRLPLMDI